MCIRDSFLAVGAEQGADHRNIPEQRHFVSGIGDGFIQQPANHHRFEMCIRDRANAAPTRRSKKYS